MSQCKKYYLLAGVLLIVVCLAFAALLLPGESVSRLIAFFLLGKTAYDIWKKETESKERVKATPQLMQFDSLQVVGVELYNAGSTPVTIKRVALVTKTDTGEISEFMPSESEAERLENSCFVESSKLPESISRLELGPKKYARFHLDRHTERMVDRILEQPGESFLIVVESFMGEVGRVLGKEIQAAILKTPYGKAVRAVALKMEKISSLA